MTAALVGMSAGAGADWYPRREYCLTRVMKHQQRANPVRSRPLALQVMHVGGSVGGGLQSALIR